MLDKYYIGEFEVSWKHPAGSIQPPGDGSETTLLMCVGREGKKLPIK